MNGIDAKRIRTLLSSAQANRLQTLETLHNYDGAIQVLTLLLDDLQAQAIAEQAGYDYGESVDNREADSPPASQPKQEA